MARRRKVQNTPKKTESPQSRKSGRARRRCDSGSNTDYISLARTLGLLVLICGICGFLFYPDIIKAMDKLRGTGEQTPEAPSKPSLDKDTDFSSGQKAAKNINKDRSSSLNREGDLMESEHPGNPSKPYDSKMRLDSKAVFDKNAESFEPDTRRQKRVAENRATESLNKLKGSVTLKKEPHESISRRDQRGQNIQSDTPMSSGSTLSDGVKRKERRATETYNDSQHPNKKTLSNTSRNPEKGKTGSTTSKTTTHLDNDILHDKMSINDLRGRDRKRKPIILRPGVSEFSIDLTKNMEEKIRVHEKRGNVVDKSKNLQGENPPVNENKNLKNQKTRSKRQQVECTQTEGEGAKDQHNHSSKQKQSKSKQSLEKSRIKQTHKTNDKGSKIKENKPNTVQSIRDEYYAEAEKANEYQHGGRKFVNGEKPNKTNSSPLPIDRNEKRKSIVASAGDSKITLDPSRLSNSDSRDKSRVKVKKTNEIHEPLKSLHRQKRNKLKGVAMNPKLVEDKNAVKFKSQILPRRTGRDSKRKPIILSADKAELTIDTLDLINSNGEDHLRPNINDNRNTKVKKKQGMRKEIGDDVQKGFKPKGTKVGTEIENNSETQTRTSLGESKMSKHSREDIADSEVLQKLSLNKNDKNEKIQRSPGTETASLNVKRQQSQTMHLSRKPSDIKKTNKETTKTDKSHKKPIKTSKGLGNKQSRLHTEKSKGIKKQQNTKEGAGEKDSSADDKDNFKSVYQKTFTPNKIFDGGRRIPPIELLPQKKTNSSVRVFLFDDFLSERECDGLMKAHDNHVQAMTNSPLMCFDGVTTLRRHLREIGKNVKVTPNVFTSGTKCLNASFSLEIQTLMKSNWSYSTAFYPGESTFSKVAAMRMQRAMGLNPESGGKFQITSYPSGKAYNTHTDCTLNALDERDRVVSVLMYLNTVEDGGETKFPELGIWVKPRKGRAIIWNNMSPEGFCEPHSQHVASVVKTGSKYILIRWYYYKNFYFLGRRPHPPELPLRDENVPMVMCDEYNMGSCRWYDEWSYDALLAYERQRATGFV